MTDADERAVVRAARAGRAEACGELFERHWLDAWRTARAITGSEDAADDVAQSAFERALRGLPGFNGRSSFRTWLHRIVVNQALNHLRAEARSAPAGVAISDASEQAGPDDLGLMSTLQALDPDRRAVIVLRHCLGYSLAETAQILGVPIGTVQSRQARAEAQLRALLEGCRDG